MNPDQQNTDASPINTNLSEQSQPVSSKPIQPNSSPNNPVEKKDSLALGLSIVGLLTSPVLFLGLPLATISLVLGIKGLKRRETYATAVVFISCLALLVALIVGRPFTRGLIRPFRGSTNTTQQQATVQEKTSQINFLTLEDFKVRIPLNDKTSKLKLGQVTSSTYSDSDKSISILAPELDSVWKCETDPADGSRGSIGSISITAQSKRSGPYEPLATKKVDTYTYGFEPGGSNCTDDPLFKELETAFKTQFEQLQAY